MPIQLALPRHFFFKCLYQDSKLIGHVYMCLPSGIDFASSTIFL